MHLFKLYLKCPLSPCRCLRMMYTCLLTLQFLVFVVEEAAPLQFLLVLAVGEVFKLPGHRSLVGTLVIFIHSREYSRGSGSALALASTAE